MFKKEGQLHTTKLSILAPVRSRRAAKLVHRLTRAVLCFKTYGSNLAIALDVLIEGYPASGSGVLSPWRPPLFQPISFR
jgi:hypothetical protein